MYVAYVVMGIGSALGGMVILSGIPNNWFNKRRGIATEAAAAVIGRLRRLGVPYVTATHDVNNPRSGAVMRRLGMKYLYSYEEFWQPKGFPVVFRLYQLNLDGDKDRAYMEYWDNSAVHFIESPGAEG